MTRLDLGECETKLRNFYNIPNNEKLYIKKIDIYQDGITALKEEYDVYAKLFGNNLINLNLTVCGTSKISIYIPIVLNDTLDKYNSSSGYYNDICYTTTSEDGTDILLKDKQKEYIDKDYIVCQENCDFSEYDYNTFVAKCSCEVKDCAKTFADMKINKYKLLENFKNIKNIINFNFLICYTKLFNREGFLNNIGCYILLAVILFHLIAILVFIIKQFSLLKKQIKKVISFENNENYNLYKKSKKHRLNTNNNSKNYNQSKKQIKKFKSNHKTTLNNSKIKINSKNIKYNFNKKDYFINFIDEEINGFSYNIAIKLIKEIIFNITFH